MCYQLWGYIIQDKVFASVQKGGTRSAFPPWLCSFEAVAWHMPDTDLVMQSNCQRCVCVYGSYCYSRWFMLYSNIGNSLTVLIHIYVYYLCWLNIEQMTNDPCKLTCYKLLQESLSHSTPVQPLFHSPPAHDGGLLSSISLNSWTW